MGVGKDSRWRIWQPVAIKMWSALAEHVMPQEMGESGRVLTGEFMGSKLCKSLCRKCEEAKVPFSCVK